MIKEIIVPIAYFLFFILLIGNTRYFKSTSISKNSLFLAFSLKVFCAVLYGYLFSNGFLTGEDTFLYFQNGNVVYNALNLEPLTYLELSLGPNDFKPIPQHLLGYTDNMHFWFDSSNYFLVRINALIRPFSFGIYNVHAIIFAFISFVGIYNLYLFFETRMYNKINLQFILFGVPSIVFWSSGVHKEAITFFGLGLILYNLDNLFLKRSLWCSILMLVIGLVFLGYVRFYLLVILLPLIIALFIIITRKLTVSSITVFIFVTGLFVLILIITDIISPEINLIDELFIRRNYFLRTIPGNMTFPVLANVPSSFSEYVTLIVESIINPIFRPFPSECKSFLPVVACIETWIYLGVVSYLFFSLKLNALSRNPYAIFSILFGLSTLFLIGLIVNNSGAIVRYRSVAIPFILIGLCLSRKENKQVVVNTN